jgi:hypothetical protein
MMNLHSIAGVKQFGLLRYGVHSILTCRSAQDVRFRPSAPGLPTASPSRGIDKR